MFCSEVSLLNYDVINGSLQSSLLDLIMYDDSYDIIEEETYQVFSSSNSEEENYPLKNKIDFIFKKEKIK